jgi:hypothetical protein
VGRLAYKLLNHDTGVRIRACQPITYTQSLPQASYFLVICTDLTRMLPESRLCERCANSPREAQSSEVNREVCAVRLVTTHSLLSSTAPSTRATRRPPAKTTETFNVLASQGRAVITTRDAADGSVFAPPLAHTRQRPTAPPRPVCLRPARLRSEVEAATCRQNTHISRSTSR